MATTANVICGRQWSSSRVADVLIQYIELWEKGRHFADDTFKYISPGLEGFGRYPVFTVVFTGKYRPGKNRFWTPKMGKTGKNTNWVIF